MKNAFFLFAISFFLFSCQDEIEVSDLSNLNDENISVRNIKCDQNFTPGNVWGSLFGPSNSNSFDEGGWLGTFEQEYFPCPEYTEDDDCCNETVIINFGQISENNLSYIFTCNQDLNEQELQELANTISNIANANLPECEGITLNPVAINVIFKFTSCCVYDNPCPFYEDPCDCQDLFPNSPYWGCCQSYSLLLEVQYARTTPCPSTICC